MQASPTKPQGIPLWRTESVVRQLTIALARVDGEFAPYQPAGAPLVRHLSVQLNHNWDAHEWLVFGFPATTWLVLLMLEDSRQSSSCCGAFAS